MTASQSWLALGIAIVVVAGILFVAHRALRQFYWRLAFCTIPLAIAALICVNATTRYRAGMGGFKFGVDLVGGTILVYEVDEQRKLPDNYKPEQLAAALKRRIDPADLKNVTIRPVSNTRVEIILATGGAHQAKAGEDAWKVLLDDVRKEYGLTDGTENNVPQGQIAELINVIKKQKPDADVAPIEAFINEHYKVSQERRHLTGEEVQNVKELISRVGSLEFRILANDRDDSAAIDAAKRYFADVKNNPKLKSDLESLALTGKPPPPPSSPEGKGFPATLGGETQNYNYSWVEIGKSERQVLGLTNANEGQPGADLWARAAEARAKGEPFLVERMFNSYFGCLLYSRNCVDVEIPEAERVTKKYEYFILTRDPEKGKEITGEYLVNVFENQDKRGGPAVGFRFNSQGGQLFGDLTSKNAPEKEEGGIKRFLAILLDGQIVSAPSLNARITTEGVIEGNFSKNEVDRYISMLRSGALPATLKPQPVSENTMGATLGADTIQKGTVAVGLAFLAVLAFMVVYYRFSGLVACVALFANLLLTVAFMAAVNATFTLPGLAGLVLMLGMAVDANVLIYERLREERDRGASLALAIRNGYDRAFPTIIDTHLSSIFTAIVLYAVGNDQLKGFGISLTVGLVISLFTSLYMTRLIFDIWLFKGWLHKLSMFRLLSRPNIDFMGIRYYWFTATIILTIFGISVFIGRLPQDLNIDFVGGTAYGGQLDKPLDIGELRKLLTEDRQKEVLAVAEVRQLDNEGFTFQISYRDGSKRNIALPNKATADDVQARAQELRDLTVEQIFPGFEDVTGNQSRYFTIRTSEKAPELVQASIGRLLGDQLKRIFMKATDRKPGQEAMLTFRDTQGEEVAASPSQVRTLLAREFKSREIVQNFALKPESKSVEGRYSKMKLQMIEPVDAAKFDAALAAAETEFAERPQPDRLETFDSQLAEETQTRAMYAIIASWGAILMYLWFRFGNWTFGLAAVLCLIHDLFFTMGIIAFCHYIDLYVPGLARLLLIQDFKIDLPSVAALLTLVGYSVNDTIVVFDRIREVRGKNPELTPQMINDSVNQTLSRTLLTSFVTWLVVIVLYVFGGEGVHLFAFCMVVGVIVGTYSSIYIASPLLLIFGEGAMSQADRQRQAQAAAGALVR